LGHTANHGDQCRCPMPCDKKVAKNELPLLVRIVKGRWSAPIASPISAQVVSLDAPSVSSTPRGVALPPSTDPKCCTSSHLVGLVDPRRLVGGGGNGGGDGEGVSGEWWWWWGFGVSPRRRRDLKPSSSHVAERHKQPPGLSRRPGAIFGAPVHSTGRGRHPLEEEAKATKSKRWRRQSRSSYGRSIESNRSVAPAPSTLRGKQPRPGRGHIGERRRPGPVPARGRRAVPH
jgi:hypothetical protein